MNGTVMEIIKASEISLSFLSSDFQGVPVFICTSARRVEKKLSETGIPVLSVNRQLSKLLLEYSSGERANRVERITKDILSNKSTVIVKDFEMLFDPRYPIDVVRLFCEKARSANVIIKWPGQYKSGTLSYAEPGQPDYHEYDCNAYMLRIIH